MNEDTNPSPDEGSGSFESSQPAQQQAIDELESQVAAAQAELEEYQRLLNDLPGIYEDKFRQKVRSVAQEIRHLLDERKALQEQVSQALNQAPETSALPQARELHLSIVRPNHRLDVRLPRFSLPAIVLPSWGSPHRRMLFLGLGGGVALILVMVALRPQMFRRTTPPPRPAMAIPLSGDASALNHLKLQASGGQSWVVVEDLQGRKLYNGILESGQSQLLPIGEGLRVRSGRPDLLLVGVGQQPLRLLGGIGDLDWVEVLPPSR